VKIDSSYRRCVYDVFTIWTWNAKDTYDVSCCEVVEEDVKLVSLDWSTVSRKHTMLTWCWFKSSLWECWDGVIRSMSWELSLAGRTSISFKCDNIKRRRSYQAQYYKKFECYSNKQRTDIMLLYRSLVACMDHVVTLCWVVSNDPWFLSSSRLQDAICPTSLYTTSRDVVQHLSSGQPKVEIEISLGYSLCLDQYRMCLLSLLYFLLLSMSEEENWVS